MSYSASGLQGSDVINLLHSGFNVTSGPSGSLVITPENPDTVISAPIQQILEQTTPIKTPTASTTLSKIFSNQSDVYKSIIILAGLGIVAYALLRR